MSFSDDDDDDDGEEEEELHLQWCDNGCALTAVSVAAYLTIHQATVDGRHPNRDESDYERVEGKILHNLSHFLQMLSIDENVVINLTLNNVLQEMRL